MTSDEQNLGGGTGGGEDDSGNTLQSTKATYQIRGNQVALVSRKPLPPDKPLPSLITILAAGGMPTFGDDGKIDIRGANGVRVTAGPPPLPATSSPTTNGVEIIVGEMQNVTIERGLLPPNQKIEMTPSGITIDAGKGSVTIQSLTSIKLSAAGGLGAITLDMDGVTIEGLVVNIKGGLFVDIKGGMVKIN
jgi:hypothetical protein